MWAEVNRGAGSALRIVLAVGLLLMLGANLPGHLSFDSVAQLYEGHFDIRETWGPPVYAWLLGRFDAVIPGASLYVAASGLLFFASLAGFVATRAKISWLGVAFAVFMLLTPQVLIYQGIVWKDIAFTDCSVGACACLTLAFAGWAFRPGRWGWLLGAAFLFALGSVVRQNGIVMPAVAALALGWVGARGDWRRGVVWAGGGLLAVVAIMQLLSATAIPSHARLTESGLKTGVRIVQNYDLIGAVTYDPTYRYAEIEKVRPKQATLVRARGPVNWSPDRVDWLDRDRVLGVALIEIPNAVVTRQWLDLVFRHPGLYLTIRWNDFRWLFLSPNPDRCLAVYTGVDAPAEKMAPLKMPHRYSGADRQLTNYDSFFEDTPLQRHWAYFLIGLIATGLLLWRRQPQDLGVAALTLGGLAVTASFFVITIACDYRYLYIQDISALVGAFYLLADPTGFRRRAGTGAG